MNKRKAIVSLLIIGLALAAGVYLAIFGIDEKKTGSLFSVKKGLDLAGGVSITYQVTGEENPTGADMADTVYKLQKRVENYSTEAFVYQEGSNRINIEIPGVSDANRILEELGRPGSLIFRDSEGKEVLSGTDIADAKATTQRDELGNNRFVVALTMTKEGTAKFAQATKEAAPNRDIIYVVYDGQVVSSPTVENPILDGQCVIQGMASYEEAENLASIIRIGGLKLELEELSSKVVGAQLGSAAIETSLKAGAIGMLLVMLFMVVVYLIPGLAASIALILYVVLMILLLNAFDLTLTLPGIAGIILSIGMAVDANVIIFARIREELAGGKVVKVAIKTGFQKALSAILDGNITTLIASLVLGIMGTGSIKGFAQTLALGILLSMFTSLVITRLLVNAFFALGIRGEKFYGSMGKIRQINFLSKKAVFFSLSLILILIGFVFMGIRKANTGDGLNYSLDFKGGTVTNIILPEEMSIEEIDRQVVPIVAETIGGGEVIPQKVQGSNEVVLKTRTLSVQEREQLNLALAESFGIDPTKITAETISPTISSEMRFDAVVAVIIATVCMLIYVGIRFKDIRFGASSVFALLHDVLVVLAFYAVAGIAVGNTFIACMLTIVGYSINATIVIFDRIRENLYLEKKKQDLAQVVNLSINQTLSRSIFTSLTTFIMVAVLYLLGVTSIKEFALPLMAGIICGTYSSICLAGALWYVLKKKEKKKD
ncbi:MAG: protein translocase subunit SecD [Lachnospiraceae bacterium]